MRAASVAFLFVTLALCNANKKTEPTPTYCDMLSEGATGENPLLDYPSCALIEKKMIVTMSYNQLQKVKKCFPKLKESIMHSGSCTLTEEDCKFKCPTKPVTGPVWGKQVYETKPFESLCEFIKEVNCNELKRRAGKPIAQTELLYS